MNYGVVLEPNDMDVKLYNVTKSANLEQKAAADRYNELYKQLIDHKARVREMKKPWYKKISLNSL